MTLTSQFVRFCVVGLTCYVTGLVLLATLTEICGLHYLASFAVSFVATNLLGFWLNGRFSFGAVAAVDGRAAARYLAVAAASLAANTVALALLVESLGMWYLLAVIVLTAVNVPINFVAHRVVTYRVQRVGPGSGRG